MVETPPVATHMEWPRETRELCFHCCDAIKGRPLPSPVACADEEAFIVQRKLFCSWNCVMADGLTNAVVFLSFYRRCTGRWPLHVNSKRSRLCLECFGGDQSYAAFHHDRDDVLVDLPPLRLQVDTYRDGVWMLGGNRDSNNVNAAASREKSHKAFGDRGTECLQPPPEQPPPVVEQLRLKRGKRKATEQKPFYDIMALMKH